MNIKELNDKDILISKYEQEKQKLKKELNDRDISLNEYKKDLSKLDDKYKTEILKKDSQELNNR